MRGAPPSPSWYGAHAACATRDGGLVYASDKAVCVLDGETGAVRGLVGTKARALAVCAATTSETREGEDDEGGGAREVVVCGCADKVLRTLDARAMAFVGKTMTGGHKHEVTATCARARSRFDATRDAMNAAALRFRVLCARRRSARSRRAR